MLDVKNYGRTNDHGIVNRRERAHALYGATSARGVTHVVLRTFRGPATIARSC